MFNITSNALIPMLHRLGYRDANRIPANQNMVIEPHELEGFIATAREIGWTFISMDELIEALRSKKPARKVIALTFDDGYLDNYERAYPILSGLNVPFCVYVTTSFIEQNLTPWWYRLEKIVSQGTGLLDLAGNRYKTTTLLDRNTAFMSLRRDLMTNQERFKICSDWIEQFPVDERSEVAERLFMTWSELQTLAKSKLVTIGAHTDTHPVLATLEDKIAYGEISRSKHILSERLKQEVKHFAFPFGGTNEVSERDIRFTREIGFSSAVTTAHGGIRTTSYQNLFALPRVFFGPDFHLRRMRLRLLKYEAKKILKKVVRQEQ